MFSSTVASLFIVSLPLICAFVVADKGRERFEAVSDPAFESTTLAALRFPRLTLVMAEDEVDVTGWERGERNMDGVEGVMKLGSVEPVRLGVASFMATSASFEPPVVEFAVGTGTELRPGAGAGAAAFFRVRFGFD